ncbi:MAG: cupredoxin domain-containing protein [Ktedonobacteraceae bacterium]
MHSKLFRIVGILLAVVALGSVLLVACARPGTPEANTGGSTPTATNGGGGSGGCAGTSVHMSSSDFVQKCANITKGSMLTLIDDVQVLHIISNGMWDSSGNQVTTKEPGAPTVSDVNISGGQKDIGPFNTAGTYHIFCSVHINMNLVVNVK